MTLCKPGIIWLDSVVSTNTYAKEHIASLPHGSAIAATYQTAGRGQRGNSWESAPGQNLLISIVLKDLHFGAAEQFAISEAVALAVVEVADEALAPSGITCRVKWPNDVYAADRKLAGILIENSLAPGTATNGDCSIAHSIAGVGLNVNQREFHSAPCATSLSMLSATHHDVQSLANHLTAAILAKAQQPATLLHSQYLQRLWRADGRPHRFAIPHADSLGHTSTYLENRARSGSLSRSFMAVIDGITPKGLLVLREEDGSRREFSFKEVVYL